MGEGAKATSNKYYNNKLTPFLSLIDSAGFPSGIQFLVESLSWCDSLPFSDNRDMFPHSKLGPSYPNARTDPGKGIQIKQLNNMALGYLVWLLLLSLVGGEGGLGVEGIGLACNWGTISTHPLPPEITVKLLKDNGFNKVKLFEAQPGVLRALGNSGIQVMLGIPNDFLAPLASSVGFAVQWVSQNVSTYLSKYGVDIR